MLGNHSKGSGHNSKRKASMSDVMMAQELIREAFPKARYGSYQRAVHAAYRFIAPRVSKEFTERRARAIWDGEARRIDMEEADALRAAKIEEMKHEQITLRARLDQIDQALAGWRADVGRGTAPEGRP